MHWVPKDAYYNELPADRHEGQAIDSLEGLHYLSSDTSSFSQKIVHVASSVVKCVCVCADVGWNVLVRTALIYS